MVGHASLAWNILGWFVILDFSSVWLSHCYCVYERLMLEQEERYIYQVLLFVADKDTVITVSMNRSITLRLDIRLL
jgi:hypothetical protein